MCGRYKENVELYCVQCVGVIKSTARAIRPRTPEKGTKVPLTPPPRTNLAGFINLCAREAMGTGVVKGISTGQEKIHRVKASFPLWIFVFPSGFSKENPARGVNAAAYTPRTILTLIFDDRLSATASGRS